jgi:hypothetical protein
MTGRDREKAFAREDERARWHAAKRQREIRERMEAAEAALREIAEHDGFELTLDPKRPQRIARRVLRIGEFA